MFILYLVCSTIGLIGFWLGIGSLLNGKTKLGLIGLAVGACFHAANSEIKVRDRARFEAEAVVADYRVLAIDHDRAVATLDGAQGVVDARVYEKYIIAGDTVRLACADKPMVRERYRCVAR